MYDLFVRMVEDDGTVFLEYAYHGLSTECLWEIVGMLHQQAEWAGIARLTLDIALPTNWPVGISG